MSLFVNLISTFDDSGLKKADGATDATGGKLTNFGKVAGAAFLAAGTAALAYAGTLLVDGVKSAIEDEKAQLRLEGALKAATGATDAQVLAVEDYITQAGVAFGITDEKLRPAFERLVRSTKDIDEAQRLTNLAMDIAAGTGKDVTTVANALAKANDGSVTALKKLGVTLGENATQYADYVTENNKLIKLQEDAAWALDAFGKNSTQYKDALAKVADQQTVVNGYGADSIDWVGELSTEFAGAAAGAANTFEGKMTRLGVAFDEAKETAGSFILDAIQPLADFAVTTLIPAMSSLGTAIGETLGPIVKDLGVFFSENVLPALKDVGKFVMETLIPNLRDALAPVIDGVKTAFNAVMQAIKDNEAPLTTIKDALFAVVGFISEYVLPVVGTLLGGAFKAAGGFISGFLNTLGGAINIVKNVLDAFGNLRDRVKDIFEKVGEFITKPFKMAFKAVAEFWNKTLGKFKIKLPDWLPIIGGKEFGFPELPVPALAKGGIVTKPTLALIGEAGPEAVVPLGKANNMGMGGNITINVSGALDPESVARQIETILKRSRLRAGAYS